MRVNSSLLALGLLSAFLLAGCQSEGAKRKAQYRELILGQCTQQVQMAAQAGLPDMSQLCPCLAQQIDAIPPEQFAQITNPMQTSQMTQQMQAQCMQSMQGSMGMGGMGGMQPGMGPGMQPGMGPGMYGGAVQGENGAAPASNVAK